MSQDWAVSIKLSAEDARRYLAAYKGAHGELGPPHGDTSPFKLVAEQIAERLEAAQADQRAFSDRAGAAADEVLPFLERARDRGGWLDGGDRFWSGIQQALAERGICLQSVVRRVPAVDDGVRFLGYRLCPDGDDRSTVDVREAGPRMTATTRPRQLGGKRSGRECKDPHCLIDDAHEVHAR